MVAVGEIIGNLQYANYIHMTDLAQAHILAVEHLQQGGESRIYNLGSEKGFSVHEVIDRAKFVTGMIFLCKRKRGGQVTPLSWLRHQSRSDKN
jgi:UDP-glucose 4-epimerase